MEPPREVVSPETVWKEPPLVSAGPPVFEHPRAWKKQAQRASAEPTPAWFSESRSVFVSRLSVQPPRVALCPLSRKFSRHPHRACFPRRARHSPPPTKLFVDDPPHLHSLHHRLQPKNQTRQPRVAAPAPDCKRINVSLVWAISRRNVVGGKYLPRPPRAPPPKRRAGPPRLLSTKPAPR